MENILEDLSNSINRIYTETSFHYMHELETEVAKIFGDNTTKLRSLNSLDNNIKKRKRIFLKSDTTPSPVDELDNYLKKFSVLSVEEANRVRNLAYEYFGRSIHAFMENVAEDDGIPLSTQLPGGGDLPDRFTPKHHHDVTELTETPEVGPTTEREYRASTVARAILRTFKAKNIE
ncbi:uncharacterized protein LOC124542359 isoform X2 [Vanessa cardui]|uniref:uncharacterized protein LOC124542359 isoform X2 n=1 Tax=Vanessa cardui TaxID=171605 RepID=UPI001F144189|nr:uncharacterized protein LOC124542359 isoform X2 [Vanessa cardui]